MVHGISEVGSAIVASSTYNHLMPLRDANETPLPQPEPGASREYFASIQDENGVDMTLILENLRLSPLERLRKCERAWRDMLWLRSHARRLPDNPPAENSHPGSEARH